MKILYKFSIYNFKLVEKNVRIFDSLMAKPMKKSSVNCYSLKKLKSLFLILTLEESWHIYNV